MQGWEATPVSMVKKGTGKDFRMDKIAMLSEILEQNPADAFARYGLAMEQASLGNTETSIEEFNRLLTQHPEYTAGYFMCAQTLVKAGRTSEAKQRLEQGIASAEKTGNQHARSEMQAVLDDLA
jgi:predicted Zn-dependent protease